MIPTPQFEKISVYRPWSRPGMECCRQRRILGDSGTANRPARHQTPRGHGLRDVLSQCHGRGPCGGSIRILRYLDICMACDTRPDRRL